jgi:hypothetical protein
VSKGAGQFAGPAPGSARGFSPRARFDHGHAQHRVGLQERPPRVLTDVQQAPEASDLHHHARDLSQNSRNACRNDADGFDPLYGDVDRVYW